MASAKVSKEQVTCRERGRPGPQNALRSSVRSEIFIDLRFLFDGSSFRSAMFLISLLKEL
jgi:hypothetical protein